MNKTMTTTADRLAAYLGITAASLTVEGQEFVVTNGTGEGGAFAYFAADVARWLDAAPETAPRRDTDDSGAVARGGYADFCERVSTIDCIRLGQPGDGLAVAVAREVADDLGWRLLRAGACTPILRDDEDEDDEDPSDASVDPPAAQR